MKFSKHIKDRMPLILGTIFLVAVIFAMGYVFKVKADYMTALTVILLFLTGSWIIYEYYKKKRFYKEVEETLAGLDQKYLITDMVKPPEFYEGELMMEAMYDVDKSMRDKINQLEAQMAEFKEYMEMWIHEIKVPISALRLMNYNQSNDLDMQKQQIDKMNYFVEQILFFARADVAEKDYLMNRVNLETIINKIVMENKTLLIGNKIKIEKENVNVQVITDSKWLEFMLGQIVNNALKYKDNKDVSYIKFSAVANEKETILSVEDNGIGISEKDLPYVFDKTFTGENGREKSVSTGMGLYICKKLCNKLGHNILVESEKGKYTRVIIKIGNNTFFDM